MEKRQHKASRNHLEMLNGWGSTMMVSNTTEVSTSSEMGPVGRTQCYSEFLNLEATW